MTDHQKLLCALLSEPDQHFDAGSDAPRVATLTLMSALAGLRVEIANSDQRPLALAAAER